MGAAAKTSRSEEADRNKVLHLDMHRLQIRGIHLGFHVTGVFY